MEITNISVINPSIKEFKYAPQSKALSFNGVPDSISFGTSLNLKSLTKEKIVKAFNFKNMLGFGAEGTVYKIPNTDFVIKVPDDKTKEIDFKKINFEVTPQDKINHIVAYIDKCEIQKYIEGVCPFREAELKFRNLTDEDYAIREVLNSMSNSNIKDFYMQILNAKNLNMIFDTGGANSILNLKTGKLTAIDFIKGVNENYPKSRTDFLSNIMSQCGGFCLLDKEIQNRFLTKSFGCLIDLIKENKILPEHVEFQSRFYNFPKMHDHYYFNCIKGLFDRFNQEPNKNTIEDIQQELSVLKKMFL